MLTLRKHIFLSLPARGLTDPANHVYGYFHQGTCPYRYEYATSVGFMLLPDKPLIL